jgi:hypothetical protein
MHGANGSTSLQISLVVAVGLVTTSIASAQGVGRVSGRALRRPSSPVLTISAPNTSTNVVSETESDSTGTTRCSYLQEIIW